MKYRVLTVILIIITLISFTVEAVGYEYTISPGKSFTTVQSGDDLSQMSQKLNMSTEELSSYFNDSGLIYLAVSDDNKTQIKISAFTDNFSSAAGDISNLDKTGISEFANAVSNSGKENFNVVTNNGREYVCVKNTRKDSGGIYTVTQYITICNNKTFYFAGYNEGEDTSQEITAAFKSFTLNENIQEAPNFTVPSVFIVIGIIIFSALAVIMAVIIVKSALKDKKSGVEKIEN